jgi:predicted O-methyltransferase YrrM
MVREQAHISASALLARLLAERRVRSDFGEEFELDSEVSPEGGAMLQKLVRELHASTTLEIGLAYGISALYICDALRTKPGARHIVIDPEQHTQWHGVGLRHLRMTGLDTMIDYRELPSHEALVDLEREGARVDVAFVDGCHTFDYVIVDMFLVDRLLRTGGVMAVDDADWPSVRKACRYFLTNRGYRVFQCSPATQSENLAGIRRTIAQLARRWPSLGERIKPEWAIRDEDLGMTPGCRYVALIKVKADDRVTTLEHELF